MLITTVNVSKLPKSCLKHIAFLLWSIPLTANLWFKIHNSLKSRMSLNKIMWSPDVQTFLYSYNILFSFTAICQPFVFSNQQSTKDLGLPPPRRAAGDETAQLGAAPSPPKGEGRICRDSMMLRDGCRSLKRISNPLGFSCLFQCSFILKFADTQPSFDWLTNWSINYVFYCVAISH